MNAQRPARAGLLVALTLLTGACTVVSDRSSIQSRQEQFERDGIVRYDLSSPPASAQKLGVREGITSGAFNRDGPDYWDYEITLPGGQVFRTQGFGHVATVDPAPLALADNVLINSRLTDIAAAKAELEAAAPVLGLDLGQVRDWAADAEQISLTTINPVDNRVFLGNNAGYLTVDVEARRSEDRDTVTLNWTFSWDYRDPEANIPPPGA